MHVRLAACWRALPLGLHRQVTHLRKQSCKTIYTARFSEIVQAANALAYAVDDGLQVLEVTSHGTCVRDDAAATVYRSHSSVLIAIEQQLQLC